MELNGVFSLVKNYLSSMGYTETLQAFDENFEQKELHEKETEVKVIQYDSPVKERRMTLDQSDPTTDSKEDVYKIINSAKKSATSKSQLSHETETMLQLADDKSGILSKKASGLS